ncbi:hypothetical protein BT69DRAFT_1293430 [Atractiella rhizophila]|nr:hypothetical protein BT69DRAFT_1293430 [Atractiella rhizophila]
MFKGHGEFAAETEGNQRHGSGLERWKVGKPCALDAAPERLDDENDAEVIVTKTEWIIGARLILATLISKKWPVFVVGESKNRSLSLALALIGQDFNQIFSSRKSYLNEMTVPSLQLSLQALRTFRDKSLHQLSQRAIVLGSQSIADLAKLHERVLLHLESTSLNSIIPIFEHQYLMKADATTLDTVYLPHHWIKDLISTFVPLKVVFFNCPWVIDRQELEWGYSTPLLIEGFISTLSRKQFPGDLILLGLLNPNCNTIKQLVTRNKRSLNRTSKGQPMEKGYTEASLKTLIERNHYQLAGISKNFMFICMLFGYQHGSDNEDIDKAGQFREKIRFEHQVWILEKKEEKVTNFGEESFVKAV